MQKQKNTLKKQNFLIYWIKDINKEQLSLIQSDMASAQESNSIRHIIIIIIIKVVVVVVVWVSLLWSTFKLSTYIIGQKKKGKNIAINFKTNYHRKIKLIPVKIDYSLL